MAEEKSPEKKKSEVETQLLEKVSATISAVNAANCVDDVVLALHSFASLLFPINTYSLSGAMSEQYSEQINREEIPSVSERSQLWEVFYRGVSFPTIARFLLYDVACNWLSCFSITVREHVYDVFFEKGLVTEVVQALVPSLDHKEKAVRSNAERLVVICLLDTEGIVQLARELSIYHDTKDSSSNPLIKVTVSRVAQLVASIPDKARRGAPKSLSSHSFFKSITVQLLAGAQEKSSEVYGEHSISPGSDLDATFVFVGEMFSRICRRGSTDLLVFELIPQILRCVQSFISSNPDTDLEAGFKSSPSFQFWFIVMEIIKDAFVMERMAEQIFHQLAAARANDTEAYWTLWILFHCSFRTQLTVRFMFVEKFLLSKVFPLCCLRWILQFSVFGCPPDSGKMKKGEDNQALLETVLRVVLVWSKRDFVQSAPLEQQVYVTAAIGLMLENMSREELDATKDVMRSILGGVSCRLESPDDLVRKMASSIALVFSKVIDPNNPLHLDDSYTDGNVDWEFGLATTNETPQSQETTDLSTDLVQKTKLDVSERRKKVKSKKKKTTKVKLVDEIIDPATLNDEVLSSEDVDDESSENSEASSDSSLQPYDLTDDDTDLKKKVSQLVDVVGALRKTDDPDGVDRALDIAEKLVRASPDELRHVAGDLVRTLIQARCADTAVEGSEDSAEEKRQKALIALLVMCPLESLDSIHKLLYSPHLDISQRIMILDVMTDAAQELANTKTVVHRKQSGSLISVSGEPEPWFLPSRKGPPGAGSWKELPDTVSPLSYTYRFERELPSKSGVVKRGKTRRWGHNRPATELDQSLNKFPLYAAAFMLPAMQGFDRRRHGVDLLGRDFVVLGKLIYMLGVCISCTALHPEAFTLAPRLLDMLSSREVCHHKEAYVRRSALFAASCTLTSLHPSFIASELLEGNEEVSRGLEWVRMWALQIADSDTDRECSTMAMSCLQLHAEMSLQASRAVDSAGTTKRGKSIGLPSNLSKGEIIIPGLNRISLN